MPKHDKNVSPSITQVSLNFFTIFSLFWCQWQDTNPQPQNYELSILPLYYPGHSLYFHSVFPFFSLPMTVAGFKPLILGSHGKCSTTVLPWQKTAYELSTHFFLSPSVNGRIQTLDLRIRGPVFYHCITKVKCNLLYFPPFLSLPMTVGGFKYPCSQDHEASVLLLFYCSSVNGWIQTSDLGITRQCSAIVLPRQNTYT